MARFHKALDPLAFGASREDQSKAAKRERWGYSTLQDEFRFAQIDDVLKMPNSQQFLVQDISTNYI